jgi:hypothetical protein
MRQELVDELVRAAQDVVNDGNEHAEARDGERVTTVDPDAFRSLREVVQKISDEAWAAIQAAGREQRAREQRGGGE